jgi:hypothetical protein
MIPDVLNGNVTPIAAATRFLMAIIVAWFAGSLLTSVTDRYTREARRTQALKTVAAARRPLAIGSGGSPPAGSVVADVEVQP